MVVVMPRLADIDSFITIRRVDAAALESVDGRNNIMLHWSPDLLPIGTMRPAAVALMPPGLAPPAHVSATHARRHPRARASASPRARRQPKSCHFTTRASAGLSITVTTMPRVWWQITTMPRAVIFASRPALPPVSFAAPHSFIAYYFHNAATRYHIAEMPLFAGLYALWAIDMSF